ncbi:MAG: hypothetical protein WKF86_11070, partial [Acidimicrobiales bacterium]
MIRRRPAPEAPFSDPSVIAPAASPKAPPQGNGNGLAPGNGAGPPPDNGWIPPAPPAPSAPPATPEPTTGTGQRPMLGELLVSKGMASAAQLAEALLQQPSSGKRLGALMVELGMVDPRQVAECLAEQLGVLLVDLRQVEPEPEAISYLPESVARRLTAIPVRVVDGHVEVAVADPLDYAVAAVIVTAVAPKPVSLVVAAS